MVRGFFCRLPECLAGGSPAAWADCLPPLLLALLLTLSFHASGCSAASNNEKEPSGPSYSPPNRPTPVREPELEDYTARAVTEIPGGMFIGGKLKDGVFLAVKEGKKHIYAFNLVKQALSELIEVKDRDNFINIYAGNTEWVVWVEHESYIIEAENKPYQWQLVAQDIITGEQIVIDSSPFSSNKMGLPPHINYTPDQLVISGENMVAYAATDLKGSTVISKLVLYDLNAREAVVVDRTGCVLDEWITECSICGSTLVWSKFKHLSDSYKLRYTRYRYSDLYLYEINTRRREQLTAKNFFHDPALYEDKLAAIYVPPNKPGQLTYNSEVVIMDLQDREILSIVHEDSPIYSKKEDTRIRAVPGIDERYISWYDGGYSNRFVYDYIRGVFLRIFAGPDDDRGNTIIMEQVLGGWVFFSTAAFESSRFCVQLPGGN